MRLPRITGFRLTLFLTYAVALFGFAIGPLRFAWVARGNDMPSSGMLVQCSMVALVWIALAIYATFAYRVRALWILLGAPLALYWPGMFFVLSGLDVVTLFHWFGQYFGKA